MYCTFEIKVVFKESTVRTGNLLGTLYSSLSIAYSFPETR